MRRNGAMTIARTPAAHAGADVRRRAWREDAGVPVEVLAPAEIKGLWPPAAIDDLYGAMNFPTDGTVNPGDATLAFAKGAVDRGVRFVPEPR